MGGGRDGELISLQVERKTTSAPQEEESMQAGIHSLSLFCVPNLAFPLPISSRLLKVSRPQRVSQRHPSILLRA